MQVYQREFLEISLAKQALKFGEWILKSGRKSPYFFNAGAFDDGKSLNIVAKCYAAVIAKAYQNLKFDALFGPAYKGIPLVAAIALVLERDYGLNFPYAFNRKEAKDHGEGGVLVGADLTGKKVLVIDDVLTAGTALRQSLKLLKSAQAQVLGLIIALDRNEKADKQNLSALELLALEENISILSIISFNDLLEFVKFNDLYRNYLPALIDYRQKYGICNEQLAISNEQ